MCAAVYSLLVLLLVTFLGCADDLSYAPSPEAPVAEWVDYGGDPGGLRYSILADITPENVDRLEIAWVHHSGDSSDGKGEARSTTSYKVAP